MPLKASLYFFIKSCICLKITYMDKIYITIEGKEYLIRQSFRSLALFETMSGKLISQMNNSVTDMLTLFYCILKGNNQAIFNYTYEEFVDILDENQQIFVEFTNYLNTILKPEGTPQKKKK